MAAANCGLPRGGSLQGCPPPQIECRTCCRVLTHLPTSAGPCPLQYVADVDNLCLMMNLLKDPSRSIQFEAFHVFKVGSRPGMGGHAAWPA